MKPPWTLIQPSAATLPQLESLLKAADLDPAGLDEHFATTLLLQVESVVVGCVALEIYGSESLLRSLAVQSNQRGAGFGSTLLSAAVELAQQTSVHSLYLLTETAAPFFARHGFTAISREAFPVALQASVQWRSVCPASAQAMCRMLI